MYTCILFIGRIFLLEARLRRIFRESFSTNVPTFRDTNTIFKTRANVKQERQKYRRTSISIYHGSLTFGNSSGSLISTDNRQVASGCSCKCARTECKMHAPNDRVHLICNHVNMQARMGPRKNNNDSHGTLIPRSWETRIGNKNRTFTIFFVLLITHSRSPSNYRRTKRIGCEYKNVSQYCCCRRRLEWRCNAWFVVVGEKLCKQTARAN